MAARGSSRLAAILQSRMGNVKDFDSSPTAEFGTMDAQARLILDSFPDEVMEPDEFIICSPAEKQQFKSGDRVLVLWADDTPVILGSIGNKK